LAAAAENWLRRMPDHVPGSLIAAIRAATVQHPGCDLPPPAPPSIGPCRLLWAARWEADKDPATFFAAIDQLEASDADYRLLVVGGGGEQAHPAFAAARRRLAHRIEVWGHQADREAYRRVLATADVVVSTARHEFFGLAVVEAVAAGCYPLVPDDLAYGEVLAGLDADMFHDRTVTDIATRLQDLCHHHSCGSLWHDDPARGQRAVQRYDWSQRAPAMDTAMEAVIAQHQSPAHPPR
jgi:glycosyltransferase involved in cell wall biosynthesis